MEDNKKTSLWELYAAFFRIGAFTFGGGYAMLPMLERECVEKHAWAKQEELLNYFAIGQCTPGVIAVNTATFVGCSQRGVLGAAIATLGVVTPSILIILAIASLLANFAHIPAVQHAFAGIRVAVAMLIFNAVVKLCKTSVKSVVDILLCVAAFVCVALFELSPVYVVLGAALVGVGRGKWGKRA
ncbi:MAG: chromate transporter [Eubacteriales bacterium]|nr:chromate transporter [Eubacteriales bacterium]